MACFVQFVVQCGLVCFCRSVEYTVNGFYRNHFTVFADVVSINLQLLTRHLEIESSPGLPPDSSESHYCSCLDYCNAVF